MQVVQLKPLAWELCYKTKQVKVKKISKESYEALQKHGFTVVIVD